MYVDFWQLVPLYLASTRRMLAVGKNFNYEIHLVFYGFDGFRPSRCPR